MKQLLRKLARRREKGQSLVEVAIFFPIFVILLAGLVEVTQIVVDQNRVSNAARVGARFMANGGDDNGMVSVSLNAITQTLLEDPAVWDVWSVRATVDDAGTGFSAWEFEHVYGISATTRFSTVVESQVQADVLAELQTMGIEATKDIRLVGTLMVHDFDSILGLDAIPFLGNVNSVRALNVMRMVGFTRSATAGCDAFPIVIHEESRSATPPGTGASPYPYPQDFGPGSPQPPPTYESFTKHRPDRPLADAEEGYVYHVKNGAGAGNFGWLKWNEGLPTSANTLQDSLAWPGNSMDYETHLNGGSGVNPLPDICTGQCPADGRFPGYVNPNDYTDSSMNIDDYVAGNTGNVNAAFIRAVLRAHIRGCDDPNDPECPDPPKPRELRMIIYRDAENTGSNVRYKISGFAVFKIHGFKLTGSTENSWILAEFVRWDNSCGRPTSGP